MLCPGCDGDNPPESEFCGFCGRSLSRLSTAPPAESLPWDSPVPAQQSWTPETQAGQRHGVQRAGRGTHRSSTAATRYLCAAVTLNPTMRRRVLEDVLEEEYRAVITTPGVDLVTVLRYALAAHRREVIRDAVLLVLLGALVISIFTVHSGIVVLLLLLAAWLTVGIEKYENSFGAVRDLRPDRFNPDQIASPASNNYVGQQLARIAAVGELGNVTVYSKFPPFVGYGTITSSWSFAVDVTRPLGDARPRPFSVHKVYDYVKAGLDELDWPGMEIMDRVMVNGRDIKDDRRFLPDPHAGPVTDIDADLMRNLMASPEERARPYLTIGMTGWQGDLAVTIFIRFLLSRTDLFVEAAHTVVAPLRAEYKAVDGEPDIDPGKFFALIGGSLIGTIPRLLGSVPRMWHVAGTERRREQKRRRVAGAGDYGALLSIREEAADTKWQRYFQIFDDARYVKVIEQRIFRSLLEFLEEHDIDASSLVNRTNTVVNNGVMVTGGGTINADSVAGGANAKATSGGIGAQAARMASRVVAAATREGSGNATSG
jgi:hypothetical protein